MSDSNKSLDTKLDDFHKKMQRQFKAKAEDSQLAKDLEDFLNYVVYNREIVGEKSNDLQALMNNELIESFRNDPIIIKLFQGKVRGVRKGEAGERAFALSLLKIIQHNISSEKTKEVIALEMEKAIKDEGVIIGKQLATVISERNSKAVLKEIQSKKSISKYTDFKPRQGKVDIDMGQANIDIDISPTSLAAKLLNITATVKNYSSFSIHLEYVNSRKAYMAIVSELDKKYSSKAIDRMYKQYYETQELVSDHIVGTHLNHFMNIYALSGYGQVYITETDLERKYAKFLMYNNTKEQVIKILSTNQIIRESIFDNEGDLGAFSTRWSKSKKGFETKLNIRRYLTN